LLPPNSLPIADSGLSRSCAIAAFERVRAPARTAAESTKIIGLDMSHIGLSATDYHSGATGTKV